MPAQHDRADEHVGKCEAGADVERVELQSVLDKRNGRLEAYLGPKQFVVGYQVDEDHIGRGGELSALPADGIAVVVLDCVGGIDPGDVADVEPGRRLGSAMQTEEAGNVIAFVLGVTRRASQKNKKNAE